MTSKPVYDHGECEWCGWIGPLANAITSDLGYSRFVELCPECKKSEITRWITAEEAAQIIQSYEED